MVLDNLFIIFAQDANRLIGSNDLDEDNRVRSKLPWTGQTADLQFFKSKCKGTIGICGKYTYKSIPRSVLDDVLDNVVILSNTMEKYDLRRNYHILSNFDKTYSHILNNPHKTFSIIGGRSVYEDFAPYASTAYVTTFDFESPTPENPIYAPSLENFVVSNKIDINNLSGKILKYKQETYENS